MGQARDEAGNIWETDIAGNAVRLVRPAPAASGGGLSLGNPDPTKGAREQLQLQIQQAQLAKMMRDAAKPDPNAPPTIDPKMDALTGDDYVKALPPPRAAQVKALAEGRMAFPTGKAAASAYWQGMLQDVAHYDPTFDAVNYNSRAKVRSDFTSGTAAKNIRALNTALGHLGHLYDQIPGTASHGGFPLATTVNAIENSYARGKGDPGVTNFGQTVSALAGELTAVYRGSGGAEADIKRYIDELSPNASRDQKAGAVSNIAGLLKSRLDALNDQYEKGMGPTRAPLNLLDDHAKHVLGVVAPSSLGDGGAGGGNTPPAGPLATGPTKFTRDPKASAIVDAMVRAGASTDQINSTLAGMKLPPVDDATVAPWRQFLARNPNYQGSMANVGTPAATTTWNRFSASPVGTGIFAGVDAGLGGLTDEFASAAGGGSLSDLNARKQAAFAANPKAAFTGQALGTVGSMAGLGALGRTTGLASRFAAPELAADIAFGGASGAGQSNDNRLLGATLGTVGGLGGNIAGRGIAGAIGAGARTRIGTALNNQVRDVFNIPRLQPASPLSAPDSAIMAAIGRAGPDDVTASLREAQQLGVPLSLADTNPNLRELAGAAVRRSPTASSLAEDALLPRTRGQYDRFTSAVENNLGPTTNIPQRSADLMSQGRAAAGDLYDRAYSNPVPSTPEMESVLGTPFGRQALGRARTIAANERRSPDELGFALNDDGSVMLNPRPNDAIAHHLGARAELDAAQEAYKAARQDPAANLDQARDRVMTARDMMREAETRLGAAPDPNAAASVPAYTTQTLDYVKRGMDDVLEEQRNPITGRLNLDEAGRAQNQVRGQLLGEVDRLNPDYAAARSAYAGPMASRDALARGGDAYRLHPDELGMQVANQTPEHLGQMQLGYRGAMVDHAGRVRDSANPWDATLGSPVARQRLETLYPSDPGAGRMMRLLELEKQMANTTNGVLGNSRTARNVIADQTFASNPLFEGALHAGAAVATHGASIPGTAARMAGSGLKSGLRLGLGRRAEAKADAIAPALLDTDPGSALGNVLRMAAEKQAWDELIAKTTPKQAAGLLGRAVGSQAALVPANR